MRHTAIVLTYSINKHTEWCTPDVCINTWAALLLYHIPSIQEVIVGRPHGACVPKFTVEVNANIAQEQWPFFKKFGGQPFPADHVRKAGEEIDELCHILEQEGVIVRRPELIDFSVDYKTPDFYSASGVHAAMPRYTIGCSGITIW